MDIEHSIAREAESVIHEAMKAHLQYGDFTSTHEAYGVLAEEVAELLEAIRSNLVRSVRNESRQVSAVALRLADICSREIELKAPEFGERSGL